MVKAEEVRSEIRRLIAEVTELDLDEIKDDAHYQDDLDVDSLMAMEVMVAVDKRFKIEVPEEEFMALTTINETVNVVMQHVEAGR